MPQEKTESTLDLQVPDKEDLAAYANYLKWFWFSECELAEPLAQFYRHDSAFPEHMRLPQVQCFRLQTSTDVEMLIALLFSC